MQLKDVTEIIREILKERDEHPPTSKYNKTIRGGLRKALRIIEQAPVVDARSQWISVKDRLPEKGERVLVSNGCFVCESYLSVSNTWMRGGCELFFMKPDYWMPLPEPPKEEA